METTKVPTNTVRRVVEALYSRRAISAEERSAALHAIRFQNIGYEIECAHLSDKIAAAVKAELKIAPASV